MSKVRGKYIRVESDEETVRVGVALALLGVTTQLVLMIWFGAAFYALGYKSRLTDRHKLQWVKGIIKSWTAVFIIMEVLMTLTTGVRLMVLRRQVKIWRLG